MALSRLTHANGVTPVNDPKTEHHTRVLATDTVESVTVPSGAVYALCSATGDFYASDITMAATPSGDITDGTGPILNPVVINVSGISTLYVIAGAATTVTLGFYL